MPARQIAPSEALDIIQRCYTAHHWRPDAASSRDARNTWLEAAVAAVHFGQAAFNPAGGDARWCIKSAGSGRPQSDDVIVEQQTRAYYDLIISAGADSWSWRLTSHSAPLPAEQSVYPPRVSALSLLTAGGSVTPPPVTPEPPPASDAVLVALAALRAQLEAIERGQALGLARLAELTGQQREDTARIGTWMVEQAQGVVSAVTGDLTPKIAATRCRLPLRATQEP